MEIIKVSAHSAPKSVAGAIAAVVRKGESAEVQSVGAGATNQAVKAIAIARFYMSESNDDLVCKPSFTNILIDGNEKTAMSFLIEKAE
jgi:stage V sporulation protein S